MSSLIFRKQLAGQTARVKGIDAHREEPWIIGSFYSGEVCIWNYQSRELIQTFYVTDVPVRAVRFIEDQDWFVCGCDDKQVRVYDYKTMDVVIQFEAHQDYIRSISLHPNRPLVLTSGDDMKIKLWDYSRDWVNEMTFEGHSNYVMSVVWNPNDQTEFATGALDSFVKIWNLEKEEASFGLEHEKGVNTVQYHPNSGVPYLLSGTDDQTVVLWNYHTGIRIHTLKNHQHHVSSVLFCPKLHLLITASEDETIQCIDLETFDIECTMRLGMGRVWALAICESRHIVGVGLDTGFMVLRWEGDMRVVCVSSDGGVVFTVEGEVHRFRIQNLPEPEFEGASVPIMSEVIAVYPFPPSSLQCSKNEEYMCILGRGEYSIYAIHTRHQKSYGKGHSFAWGPKIGQYAVLEANTKIRIYDNFKGIARYYHTLGGTQLLGGKGAAFAIQTEGILTFHEWERGNQIHKMTLNAAVKQVEWNNSGTQVAVVAENETFLLQLKPTFGDEEVENTISSRSSLEEISLTSLEVINEKFTRVVWFRDVLIFCTDNHLLGYYLGHQMFIFSRFDPFAYLIGYRVEENHVYLLTPDNTIIRYVLPQEVLEFKVLVLKKQVDKAMQRIHTLPLKWHPRVARFLEFQGYAKLAQQLTLKGILKLCLALTNRDFELALEIAHLEHDPLMWKRLGECALNFGEDSIGEIAFWQCEDYYNLIKLYARTRDQDGLRRIMDNALSKKLTNVSVITAHLLGERQKCVETLVASKMYDQARRYAHNYPETTKKLERHTTGNEEGSTPEKPSLTPKHPDFANRSTSPTIKKNTKEPEGDGAAQSKSKPSDLKEYSGTQDSPSPASARGGGFSNVTCEKKFQISKAGRNLLPPPEKQKEGEEHTEPGRSSLENVFSTLASPTKRVTLSVPSTIPTNTFDPDEKGYCEGMSQRPVPTSIPLLSRQKTRSFRNKKKGFSTSLESETSSSLSSESLHDPFENEAFTIKHFLSTHHHKKKVQR